MVDPRIPGSLIEPIRQYADLLDRFLPGMVAGSYLHGSLALGAFNHDSSDIDFLTVLTGIPSGSRIAELHRELRRESRWGKRFEGLYMVADSVVSWSPETEHLYIQRGRPRGRHRLDAVACRLARASGIVIAGRPAESLIPAISRSELEQEMLRNLNIYWRGRLRRPHLFLFTSMVDFAVGTLPRIHHTLQTGQLISKPEALAWLGEQFPQWRVLAQEVLARQNGTMGGGMFEGMGRAIETTRFVREMIEVGNEYVREK